MAGGNGRRGHRHQRDVAQLHELAQREPILRGDGRLPVRPAHAHRTRRRAIDPRPDRDARLLRAPRHAAAARTSLHRSRRPARRGRHGRAQSPVLVRRAWRRPSHCRRRADPRRSAVRGRRRRGAVLGDTPGRLLPLARPDHRLRDQPEPARIDAGDRPPEAGRHAAGGSRGPRDHHAAPGRGRSGPQERTPQLRRDPGRARDRRARAAAHADGRGGARPSHRVRERGKPAALARHVARDGIHHTSRDWRRPRPAGASAVHREHAHRRGRRRRGVLLAWWTRHLLVAMAPQDIPRLAETSLDFPVLLFASLLSLATGLVFGMAPVVTASRIDPTTALKAGARTLAETRRASTRAASWWSGRSP